MASVLTNRQDFKSFFEKYFEPVFQFTRKYTGDEAIAHDITQDAFIKLYEKRENFDVIEKAKSFVYITARNLCLDHLKHLKIEHEYARSFPLDEAEEQQFFFEEITYQETLRILYDFPHKPGKSFLSVLTERTITKLPQRLTFQSTRSKL